MTVANGKKWLLIPLVWLVLTTALLEASLPLFHRRYATFFRRNLTPASLRVEDARRFVSSKTFDPVLGWDQDPIARNHHAERRYLAQAYGDSFVHGDEVESEDTWEAHFERLTGKPILNLGAGAYGLDQAVLKFEKYGHRYPTRIAILGLNNQAFRRALSYHSYYYFNTDGFIFAFKPIFVKIDNRFELIRPPCSDAACLMQVLSNPADEMWQDLERYDYWYRDNEKKPVYGFPNAIKFAYVLPRILRARRELRGAENYFFVNRDSLEVVEYIIERFVNDSRDMGMTPVCVTLYSATDLQVIKTGIRLDAELLQFLAAKRILYVDTAEYILQQYRQDDGFVGLRAQYAHLNSRGNLMVAEALTKGLASIGLLGI